MNKAVKFLKANGLAILVGIAIVMVILLIWKKATRSSGGSPTSGPVSGPGGKFGFGPSGGDYMMGGVPNTYRPYTNSGSEMFEDEDDEDDEDYEEDIETFMDTPAPMVESEKAMETAMSMYADAKEAKKEAKKTQRKTIEASEATFAGGDLVEVTNKMKDVEMKAQNVEKKAKDVERGVRGVAYETVSDDVARQAYGLEIDVKDLKQDAVEIKETAKELAREPEGATDPDKMDRLKLKADELAKKMRSVKSRAKDVAKCVCPNDINSDSESDDGYDSSDSEGRDMPVKGFRGFRVDERAFADPKTDYMLL